MSTLISTLRENRAALQRELESILRPPTAQNRNLTSAESAQFDAAKDSIKALDDRIDELHTLEGLQRDADEARRIAGGGEPRFYTSGSSPYRKDDPTTSFFLDLRNAQRGDAAAIDRLARNQSEAVAEKRAGDMSTTAGAGGEFAPPGWMVQDYVALARPGRVTADLLTANPLPPGISSVNLPKVATGTTAAVQATQNSTVSDTAMTSTSVSSGITTIAGKQVISLQLVEQSGAPIDQVIFKDLTAAHAAALDTQVLYGSNASGQLAGISGAVGNTVTYTSATPKVASTTTADSFLHQILAATGKVFTGIFRAPNAVVMHPRRWLWVLDALDGNSRPLVVPQGAQFNGPAVSDQPRAEGSVGVLAGVDAYVDPNVSTTANSTTNQDEVYVVKADELWLWESPLKAEAFDATYADQLSLLLRVYSYAALIANRQPKAISVIRGTGLVDPGLS